MALVHLDDLTIAYRGPPLLDGVTRQVEAGQRIGLLGRNGSGKTTLLKMIAGLEQPDRGRCVVAPGTRVASLSQEVPLDLAGEALTVVRQALDAAVAALYAALLPAFKQSAVGRGEYEMPVPSRAWADNPTSQCIILIQWQRLGKQDDFDLVAVNLAPHRAQCWGRLTARGLSGGQWILSDRLGAERWERDGTELATKGLYLDLEARGARLFAAQRASP